MMKKLTALFVLLNLWNVTIWSQEDRSWLIEVEKQLDSLQQDSVPLDRKVTIAMDGQIDELITFLAQSTQLNIAIDPNIRENVSVAFTSVAVKDILLHLCDTYNLSIRPSGQIIYLINKPVVQIPPQQKPINITFDNTTGFFEMDLRRDTLERVAQLITSLSGQNIAVSPNAKAALVSTYIKDLAFADALEQLATSNNLSIEQTPNYFLLQTDEEAAVFGPTAPTQNNNSNNGAALSIKKVGTGLVNVRAENISVLNLVKAVGDALEQDYVLLPGVQVGSLNTNRNAQTQISGDQVSIQLRDISFEALLEYISRNSPYYYDLQSGTFLIGLREAEGLRKTSVIQMQYRSARGIETFIPERMTEGVAIDSLYELNSIILSGSEKNVDEITQFLQSIDKAVPIVMIELTIIDVQVSQLDDVGIEAGVDPEGRPSGGTIIGEGGLDFTFSSGAINDFLGVLGERGIINLGQVTPDFYVTLRALQESGIIDIESTPRLSTLNSHPALLKIGQKRYFQEQQVNFPGFDRPVPVQANVFREVEANLEILINPMVNGDKEVTLDIGFEQSEFIGDPGPTAPPPQVTRRFDSMIRVKDGEVIALGGLERNVKSVTRSGIPWLSRIPVIGWIFGRKRKNKQNEKLIILIKPTVIG